MSDSKLAIVERDADDVTILTLRGEIELDDGDLALRARIHNLLDRGRTKLVLDLAGVSHMDSSGVGMIVGKMKTLRERGGDLKLLNLQTRGQRLFGTMKLLMIFEMFDSEEAAVKSYRSQS